MFIVCLLRTVLSNPGFMENEYENMYSIVKFISNIFNYYLHMKDPDFKFESNYFNTYNTSLVKDLENIINMEKMINERMLDHSTTQNVSKYNSIDVTKKNIFAEFEDLTDTLNLKDPNRDINNKDNFNKTLLVSEDLVENYEFELENFIKNNPKYEMINLLPSFKKDNKNYRFCAYCLHKKVLYAI